MKHLGMKMLGLINMNFMSCDESNKIIASWTYF